MAGMGWEGFSHPTGRLPLPVGTLWGFTKESRVRVYLTSHGVFPAKVSCHRNSPPQKSFLAQGPWDCSPRAAEGAP